MKDGKLTLKDFAKLCEVTPTTIYSYINRGIISPRKTPIGKNYFLEEDVEKLNESLKKFSKSQTND